jgi:hypothetical protein
MESWCLFVLIFWGCFLIYIGQSYNGNDQEKILSNKFQPIFLLQKSVNTINFVTMFLLSLGTKFIEIQEGTNLLTTNISRLPNLQDFNDI